MSDQNKFTMNIQYHHFCSNCHVAASTDFWSLLIYCNVNSKLTVHDYSFLQEKIEHLVTFNQKFLVSIHSYIHKKIIKHSNTSKKFRYTITNVIYE